MWNGARYRFWYGAVRQKAMVILRLATVDSTLISVDTTHYTADATFFP